MRLQLRLDTSCSAGLDIQVYPAVPFSTAHGQAAC